MQPASTDNQKFIEIHNKIRNNVPCNVAVGRLSSNWSKVLYPQSTDMILNEKSFSAYLMCTYKF